MDDSQGRAYELQQAAVKCMRGILFCYMRQADKVSVWKLLLKSYDAHSKWNKINVFCERFEPRSHFKRLSLIVQVNIVLNRTVVVDSDWRFDNVCMVLVTVGYDSVVAEHHLTTKHQIDWDSATYITYSTDYYQRLTLESWFTNLEQTPLNRSQQLPAT